MRLNRAKRIGLAAGLCLVVGALVVVLRKAPEEPVYQDHPISYWFNQLPLTTAQPRGMIMIWYSVVAGGRQYGVPGGTTNVVEVEAIQKEALRAIQAIGTNGLPFLIRKLGRRETPKFAQNLQRWAFKHGFKHPILPNPELERAQAVTALRALTPLPPDAMAQVCQLTNHSTNATALAAAYVLGSKAKAIGRVVSTQFP